MTMQEYVTNRLDALVISEMKLAADLIGESRELSPKDPLFKEKLMLASRHLSVCDILDRASAEARALIPIKEKKAKKKAIPTLESPLPLLH